MKCISCGANLESEENMSKFPCPKCKNTTLGRCGQCKTLSREYTCPECGFVGP